MTEFAILSTTVADADAARHLAERLVAMRLAACVQIAPITSVYRWEGRIETAAEQRLLCKIAAADVAEAAAVITAVHPYAVPELVTTPITVEGALYRDWLAASTRR